MIITTQIVLSMACLMAPPVYLPEAGKERLLFRSPAKGKKDIAVLIDAVHLCVSSSGIKDSNSSTDTAENSGAFPDPARKNEFLKYIA